ncbi:hypothetical protein IEQ34_009956 [Dendrobium chrysotoxum]|uniref:B box-type domain-containing protein n=1 Tax=Dendrobium chrysotoxum TaxID=161865 RepID=A0AAV7H1U9_DENCH|nr:hypothetical protein IEQ34_009956 [Dendrobium chrysotoxum]
MGKEKAGGGSTSCDYCSDATTVLYCRPDTARLCVACDRQVHEANVLSRKHFRSQICDNCGTAAAVAGCTDHGLVLCSDCDSEAHSAIKGHMRVVIEGFSSCPSAIVLTASWGLELDLKDCSECRDLTLFDGLATLDSDFADPYVPCVAVGGTKSVLLQQLEEIARRESKSADEGGGDLSPRMPCRSSNGLSGDSEVDRRKLQ